MSKTISSCQERTYDVLLVEDNASDARLLQIAWSLNNVAETHLTVLQDSAMLLPYLRRQGEYRQVHSPNLILLDYHRPEDGSATLAALREASAFAHIPVVVFTALDSPQPVLDLYHRQANCCLCKPADTGKFLELIEKVARQWLLGAMPPPYAAPALVHDVRM